LERHEAREFALSVRNLTKYYGNLQAVKNLTFGVKKEECFGLLGKF
jgi:ABC-type multidrug transport system ATPase subunit